MMPGSAVLEMSTKAAVKDVSIDAAIEIDIQLKLNKEMH